MTGEEAEPFDDVDVYSQPISLGTRLGDPIVSGATWNTCTFINGVTPGCTTSNASDVSFAWQAPSAGTFTFTTKPIVSTTMQPIDNNVDAVLVLAPYESPGTQLACRNAVSGTGSESASITLMTGQRLIITVDGYASLCGTFGLSIVRN